MNQFQTAGSRRVGLGCLSLGRKGAVFQARQRASSQAGKWENVGLGKGGVGGTENRGNAGSWEGCLDMRQKQEEVMGYGVAC